MEKRGHVLVLTYPAQGHINPLLQFAKRLASKGLKATFATTHYTVNSIHADGVDVRPISDGYDDGGFKHAPSVEAYLESFKTVGSRTVTELILEFKNSPSPVDCLVFDSLLPWALDVARELGVYGAVLLTNSASVCSMYWHIHQGLLGLPVKPENLPVVFPGVPPLGFSDMPSFLAQPADHSAYLATIMEKIECLDQHDWVFVNTFEELESELAKAMSGLWPVEMAGPVLPSAYVDGQIEGDTDYAPDL
ncbi:unnamed protein product [Ilex paraguariensis]|uniref:Glycosyltransferase N-terminal domain-containing protein n=1 Tax=Ilex paraguariensis TaxID=185542 RepID=A0ABC8UBG4_9AQUA